MSAITFASGLFIGMASVALAMGGGKDWALLFVPALVGLAATAIREVNRA